MKLLHTKIRRLSTKLTGTMILIIVPLLSLLIYSNVNMLNTAKKESLQKSEDMLKMQIAGIDSEVDSVNRILSKIIIQSDYYNNVIYAKNDDDFIWNRMQLSYELNDYLGYYEHLYSLFVAFPQENDILFSNRANGNITIRDAIEEYLREQLLESDIQKRDSQWKYVYLDNQGYIYVIVQNMNTYLGAWIPVSELFWDDELHMDDTRLFFCSGEDALLKVPNGKNSYDIVRYDREEPEKEKGFSVQAKSEHGDFTFLLIQDNIFSGMELIKTQVPILVITIICIVAIPLSLIVLRRTVLKPINHIISTTDYIKQNNTDMEISVGNAAMEFEVLSDSLNSMLNEINKLKISIYEEKIAKQKVELSYLKLQIDPHFYMNTINIIYNMAQMKNYVSIQRISECLISYLRYTFKNNYEYSLLREELQHVQDYLEIQYMRYPGHFSFSISVEPECRDAVIVPLSLHTFIENAIKYGSREDMKINVSVEKSSQDGIETLKMKVKDNGIGFEPETLARLNDGQKIVDADREHIGIYNLRQRLEILFPGKVYMYFENEADGGAAVEIRIPFLTEVPNS